MHVIAQRTKLPVNILHSLRNKVKGNYTTFPGNQSDRYRHKSYVHVPYDKRAREEMERWEKGQPQGNRQGEDIRHPQPPFRVSSKQVMGLWVA